MNYQVSMNRKGVNPTNVFSKILPKAKMLEVLDAMTILPKYGVPKPGYVGGVMPNFTYDKDRLLKGVQRNVFYPNIEDAARKVYELGKALGNEVGDESEYDFERKSLSSEWKYKKMPWLGIEVESSRIGGTSGIKIEFYIDLTADETSEMMKQIYPPMQDQQDIPEVNWAEGCDELGQKFVEGGLAIYTNFQSCTFEYVRIVKILPKMLLVKFRNGEEVRVAKASVIMK